MSNKMAKFGLVIMVIHLLFGMWSTPVRADTQLPELIRLHVLANSESLEDQRIKLTVRDELLATLLPLLATATTMAEAEEVLKANLGLLAQTANDALVQVGADYEAKVQFGLFNFPAKCYGPLNLTPGRYTALNVTLGEGGGRNWWCVVFPTMCFTAGICEELEEPEPEQTYHLRSKIMEWLERIWNWCSGSK